MGQRSVPCHHEVSSFGQDFSQASSHPHFPLSHPLSLSLYLSTVRSDAEERTFWGARVDVLIFRLRSYHVLIMYSAECDGPKFYKTLMFLGQARMFLSFQARRSSATRSSPSDLTVSLLLLFCTEIMWSQELGALFLFSFPSVIHVDLHWHHDSAWMPRYEFLQNRHLFWPAVLRDMYVWCKA